MIDAAKIRRALHHGLRIVSISLLIGVCQGQLKFDQGPRLIHDVLREGQTSGSVVYSDKYEFVCSRIPDPPHVPWSRKIGGPVVVLQDMFSGDSRMEVTQDSNGIVRMVEKDVPTDILDVKIHHIKFDASHAAFPKLFHGPNMALLTILSSPELSAFEEEHHIVPTDFRVEGFMGQDLPALTGELNEVTLSQALDYVLGTFPGYWVYENCTNDDGRRSLYFRFYY